MAVRTIRLEIKEATTSQITAERRAKMLVWDTNIEALKYTSAANKTHTIVTLNENMDVPYEIPSAIPRNFVISGFLMIRYDSTRSGRFVCHPDGNMQISLFSGESYTNLGINMAPTNMLDVNGNIGVKELIKYNHDIVGDTWIRFAEDKIEFRAGYKIMLTLVENLAESYLVQYVRSSDLDATILEANHLCFYLDETGNNLKVRVKYSNGTTSKVGTISLI